MKLLFNLTFCASLFTFIACNGTKKAADTTAVAKTEVKGIMGDAPGMITWAAANERYSADGKFNKWNFSSVRMKGTDLTTLNATVDIDLTSIWEKSDKLVEHLKAWDYFDVAKYQDAKLVISNVRKVGREMHIADMELQMRDKVQKMESHFKVTSMKPLRVMGTAKVDRGIFGIGTDNTSVPNMIEVSYDTVIPN